MILQEIVKSTKNRVEEFKKELSLEEIKSRIYVDGKVKSFNHREAFGFEKALLQASSSSKPNIALICEVKKASPSKGIISHDFPYQGIAKEYEKAGATAISVLTEPKFFLGCDQYLMDISQNTHIPVLRKDFIIDEYQIYRSKILGADAILLICSLLSTDILEKYLKICDDLGLSALVEAHNKEEINSALKAGARIIGVNNRNLASFEVDIQNCIRLRELVPRDIIFIAESGIHSVEDIHTLRKAGVHGVLIGETLMKSKDREKLIKEMLYLAE